MKDDLITGRSRGRDQPPLPNGGRRRPPASPPADGASLVDLDSSRSDLTTEIARALLDRNPKLAQSAFAAQAAGMGGFDDPLIDEHLVAAAAGSTVASVLKWTENTRRGAGSAPTGWPLPVQINDGLGGRVRRWRLSDVRRWLESRRPAAGGSAPEAA